MHNSCVQILLNVIMNVCFLFFFLSYKFVYHSTLVRKTRSMGPALILPDVIRVVNVVFQEILALRKLCH